MGYSRVVHCLHFCTASTCWEFTGKEEAGGGNDWFGGLVCADDINIVLMTESSAEL